jgi:hypothetical protein
MSPARLACLSVLLGVMTPSARAAEMPLTYEKDVRPILKAACFQCHGEEPKPKGKLDLRLVKLMRKGGRSGPAVRPGKPDESLLWERVAADEMPRGPKKLTPAQKAVLKAWIAQGARTARPEPDDPALARFTEEELNHWAFQPVRRPAVPAAPPAAGARNPVDAFLWARLNGKGLSFSPEADRRTLIRRATFDLLGLPPTPEEVSAFVNDPSPDAYEKLLDRLLASPHYGERWGRHWLDLAGYAETEGNPGKDTPRPFAWHYRDYVLRSFAADKPYDRFLQEQLAGDEMVQRPLDPTDPGTLDKLTATGFLRMAPDVTETSASLADRNQAVADVLKVVSSAVLGLTVACAQCHDHRYDPIPTEDYYRLRAVFDPAFDLARWKKPSQRVVDVTPKAVAAEAARIEAAARQGKAEIEAKKQEVAVAVLEKMLLDVPEADRAALKAAALAVPYRLTASQKALLARYPRVKPAWVIKAFLQLYDKEAAKRFAEQEKEVARLRATKPAAVCLMTVRETVPPPASRVFARGDPEQPRQPVKPGELSVLARHRPAAGLPVVAPGPTTGRRLAYARQLTDGAHPLTARVLVNRVWLHHFGKGIVRTPADFGLNGERPTHPELLEWLASDFVAHGWRLKRLHRLLMTSAAYRQRARRTAALDRIDPDNRLLGRMNVRRLDAEALRDGLLAVTGELNRQVGGPSVPVTEDYEGRGVLGRRELSVFGKPYGPFEPVPDAVARRRTVYVEVVRATPLSLLDVFDLPALTPNCDARASSTGVTQSLVFLNDAYVVARADRLADRLWAEAKGPADRVRQAFQLLYAAEPTRDELDRCARFLTAQAAYFRTTGDAGWRAEVKKRPHAPDVRALSALCQALLATNRFLYVD